MERLAKARRFDAMCRKLGYTRAAAAKTLQVSERTLHNWVSGTTAVPYAAYKLLRVLCFHEIPFKTWHGWHFAGGKLWSPEGYGFTGLDGSWWSLLVRQAKSSGVLFEQQRGRAAGGGHGGRRTRAHTQNGRRSPWSLSSLWRARFQQARALGGSCLLSATLKHPRW